MDERKVYLVVDLFFGQKDIKNIFKFISNQENVYFNKMRCYFYLLD